ncbi:hypothetical protein Bca101_043486 [Brassica carinata]
MKKELNPIGNIFPYLVKDGRAACGSEAPKPFAVSRIKSIPQISAPTDAAVMTALLIDAHCLSGVDVCKSLTPRVLPDAAKQLVVKFYNCPFVTHTFNKHNLRCHNISPYSGGQSYSPTSSSLHIWRWVRA